jgi:hypothetical protein
LLAASLIFPCLAQDYFAPGSLEDPSTWTNPPVVPSDQPPPLPALRSWTVTAMDGDSTAREYQEPVTNAASGAVTTKLHRVVEVASGLNYVDDSGHWAASVSSISLLPDGGAAGLLGQMKVYFSPVLSDTLLVTKSNRVFQTHPTGLYYLDPDTGQELQLAAAQGVQGELIPPNQILYPSAFSSKLIDADLLLTYSKLGFESDVVITRKPKATPADCGMGPNTLLQVRHEWVDAPPPSIWTNIVTTGGEPRADEVLDFGDILFPPGKAFSWPNAEAREPGTPAQISITQPGDGAVPVTKEWLDGSPSILIESVPWSAIATNLASLPEMGQVSHPNKGTELALGGSGSAPESPGSSGAKRILVASLGRRPTGVVIDYITVNSGGNYMFDTGGTYFVSGTAEFSGTVTFAQNCIVKYAPGSEVVIAGTLSCRGTSTSRSVLTSRDDPSFGETTTLPGYTGCPATSGFGTALYFFRRASFTSAGLRIRWASTGLYFGAGAGCSLYPQTVSDCLFEDCGGATYAPQNPVTISGSPDTSYIRDVAVPISSGCFVTGSFEEQVPLLSKVASDTVALAANDTYAYPDNQLLYTDNNFSAYNTNCWIYGIPGFSACSPSNWLACGCGDWRQGAGTMIGNRYAISAWHMCKGMSNASVLFLGSDNTRQIVTCKGVIEVTNASNSATTDVGILVFDQDVIASVDRVKLLPSSWTNKAPFLLLSDPSIQCPATCLPCIVMSQYDYISPVDITHVLNPSNWPGYEELDYRETLNTTGGYWTNWSVWLPESKWLGYIHVGDCGHPIWALINGELVAAGTWYAPTGPCWGFHTEDINTAIRNLANAFVPPLPTCAVTNVDLSGFPDL